MVNAILTFRTEPARVTEFHELVHELKMELRNTPGCLGVRLLHGTDDPTYFTLIEEWETEERHSRHLTGLIADGVWSRLCNLLADEPEHRYCAEL